MSKIKAPSGPCPLCGPSGIILCLCQLLGLQTLLGLWLCNPILTCKHPLPKSVHIPRLQGLGCGRSYCGVALRVLLAKR